MRQIKHIAGLLELKIDDIRVAVRRGDLDNRSPIQHRPGIGVDPEIGLSKKQHVSLRLGEDEWDRPLLPV